VAKLQGFSRWLGSKMSLVYLALGFDKHCAWSPKL
jgi:hypothetical protein